jgi:hypothetical protein
MANKGFHSKGSGNPLPRANRRIDANGNETNTLDNQAENVRDMIKDQNPNAYDKGTSAPLPRANRRIDANGNETDSLDNQAENVRDMIKDQNPNAYPSDGPTPTPTGSSPMGSGSSATPTSSKPAPAGYTGAHRAESPLEKWRNRSDDKYADKTEAKDATARTPEFVRGLVNKYGAAAGWTGKNKKGLLAGGGLVGFIIAIVMGFLALLPLKIEAFMKAIYGEQGANVEHAVERRAERIFIKYAFQQTLSPDGGIVATGNPLGDLYRTWKVQKFENSFYERSGIKFEKGSKPNSVRLTVDGDMKEYFSETEWAQYFDKDLHGKEAKKFLNIALRDSTKWHQVLKRRHLRRWMSNAYHIRSWKFFDKNQSEKDTKANFDTDLAKAENEPSQQEIGEGLSCMMGATEQCPDGTPDSTEEVTTPEDAKAADGDVQKAAGKAITESVEEATSEGFAKTISKKIISVLASKAVPIVGWVDLAAHIDDFMWNKRYEKVVVAIRTVQYASVFATWQIIDDQMKDGNNITGPQVNASLAALDGLENSRAFQEVFMGKAAGKDVSKLKIVNPFKDMFDFYKSGPLFVLHGAMWLWLHSAGYVLNLLGDVTAWLINLIPGITTLEDWVGEHLVKLMELVLGPVVGKKEGGLNTANAIRVGADVVMNDYAKNELGGEPLKPNQVAAVNQLVADEHRTDGTPLMQRLFSTDDPGSFIARLAVTLPSSPFLAVRQGFNHLIASISNPMDFLNNGLELAYGAADSSASAAAASNVDRYGVEHYGWTDAAAFADITPQQITDLETAKDKAIADGRTIDQIRAEDCPEVPKGQKNYCKLNIVSIQALKAVYTTNDDGGFNSDKPVASAAAGTTDGGTQPAPGQSCGTAQNCAKLLLKLADAGRLKFNGYNAANGQLEPKKVRHDLELTAANQPIHSADSCNNDVILNATLLNALYQSVLHFNEITVDSFVTTHGGSCASTRYHPQGRAMDIWNVNDKRTSSTLANSNPLDTEFAYFIQTYLPKNVGAEILQANKCFRAPDLRKDIGDNFDTCDHVHVDVGKAP